ncbi:glutamyl-tRNA reductase [Pseudodesulfovibrio aespoeensis]|uniref:glutamyl-tRNA reductase n=1 Tax=Pseudodesulfovibrio aespoeensis TaxID=182210 RepID=UPI0023533C4C|nr:glutamyl-tRNA reductase [Pseudodesulfovibrio aespoeensis]MCG2731501.1 glutamyl-tRNA reductase [Pseudodesulfovibrio aespoeensis]
MNGKIILVGLNHRTAGVDVREKFALTNVENFEAGLMAHCPLAECMALSTCNRVEIVAVVKRVSEREALDAVINYWAGICKGSPDLLVENTYQYVDLEAVEHLFTVASSLDSMVMGEPQILGQLKDSYRNPVDKGAARTIINRLLHKSFSVAKRVRTETAIASSAVSISYAAVELAKKIFGALDGTRAMLVGAGEMAELAATHLLQNGVRDIIIANRTLGRARELASTMGGQPIQIEQMYDHLHEVDIVISSTGSPVAVIKAREVKAILKKRKNKPMFFIDIAVPRDIDPDVNNLDNVYLYDIDDLKEVVEENMAQRQGEAVKARAVVEAETKVFGNWLNSLALQPTIVDLVDRSEDIALRELAKTLKKIGPVDETTRNSLETLVLSVGRKALHEPICFLKRRTQEEGSADQFIDMARRMFNLDDETVPPDAHLDRKNCGCAPEDIDRLIDASKTKEQ